MKRFLHTASLVAALLGAACMKDGPAAPSGTQASLRIRFQSGTTGEQVQVRIVGIIPDSETAGTLLLEQTYPAAANTSQVTAVFDLTPCLAQGQSDSQGAFCTIQATVTLLDKGAVLDQRFLGQMQVRPGQTVQTDPVILVAGSNPPVITANDTGRQVETGLIRYHITGSDPDGDLTGLFSTDIADAASDRNTQIDFFPPLRTIDGTYYAFETPFAQANQLATFVFDSKFNSSQLDTIPVGFAIGDAFVDSMSVDTTADSVIVDVVSTSDSVEIVLRNPDDGRPDTLYSVCGGSQTLQGVTRRFACGRAVPFTQALAIAVPIDPLGRAGTGLRCGVPATGCTVSSPSASRRPRR